jgi:hypothetical protein
VSGSATTSDERGGRCSLRLLGVEVITAPSGVSTTALCAPVNDRASSATSWRMASRSNPGRASAAWVRITCSSTRCPFMTGRSARAECSLSENERTSLPADEEMTVRTADVFPAGRRLETLLVREANPEESGIATLFAATDLRVDEAFERITQLERRLEQLETAPPPHADRKLAYVIFLSTPEGYQLVSDFGVLPTAGDRVGAADVLRVGLSPLPDDARPCVFAVTATVESTDVAEAEAALDRRAA